MRQTRQTLSAADQVSISNALYLAASIAEEDAKAFNGQSPGQRRIANTFIDQAKSYRALAQRIDAADALILDEPTPRT